MTVKSGLKVVAANVALLLLLLALVEGSSGVMLFCLNLVESSGTNLAERFHTRYDPDLGWANIPGKHIPDFYGPGKEVRINGQGFRSDHDFSAQIPEGKVRIVTSGDSFTFGFGVSGKNAWPSLLAAHNSAIETVNMGQGGYGIDQMYLWYLRDGLRLEHDIHLFAFIGNDFARMLHDNLEGYAKPFLRLEHGSLVTRNTPVPRASYLLGWVTRNREAVSRLATARLLARLARRGDGDAVDVGNKEQLVETVFATLSGVNRAKGRPFVLVWLPTYNNAEHDELREGVHLISEKNGWHFVDLTDEMEKLGDASKLLFIPDDGTQPPFSGAAGHYSEEGNRFIAGALYRRLEMIPEIAGKLHAFD